MTSRDHLQKASVSAKMFFNSIPVGVILLLQIVRFSEALYEGCDYVYNLNLNSVVYLQSPYYANKYPSGSSCRYKIIAPPDQEIVAECTIAIDKGPNACTTEFFYISREGDSSLTGADLFCGSGSVSRTSLFRNLVFAYESRSERNSGVGGSFNCKLTTRPQACDCGWSINTRIVGGEDASKLEFPSMVGLYDIPSRTVFCGGTIIDHRTIATATHCTRLYPNPNNTLIIAGDHDLSSSTESQYATTYRVYKYIEHPSYNSSNNANDIALLITNSDIEWNRGVGPICLPLDQTSNNFDYTNVYVVGWGTTSFAGSRSNILQKALVNILPNSACKSAYPALINTHMCTYYQNKDACQFDSGGPVINKGATREYLLGLISFGFACGSNPGVNTRVTSFVDWIQRNSAGNVCFKPYR